MAKNKRGRPTKYDPRFIDEVDSYLQTCGKEQTKLPTKEEFAQIIGVDDETLIEWRKKYERFSAAIKKIESAQKIQLINDGIYGGKEVNATMCIFLLKANHGLVETDKHVFESDTLINLNTKYETNQLSGDSAVSTKTA